MVQEFGKRHDTCIKIIKDYKYCEKGRKKNIAQLILKRRMVVRSWEDKFYLLLRRVKNYGLK